MKKIVYILIVLFLNSNSVAIETNRLTDITDGDDNAKIKIFAYQSLTCSHCATFHKEIYPLLKKEFIDTGIIKIYFKHFPLDLAALNAAKILQCIDKKSRIAFLDHLYETQKIWTIGEKIEDINNNLKNSVLMFGIDEKNFENCLVLEDVEDYILNSRIEAAKNYKIESTPTIIINDEKFEGSLDYKTLKEEIEKLI